MLKKQEERGIEIVKGSGGGSQEASTLCFLFGKLDAGTFI